MPVDPEIVAAFEQAGALLEGHFELASGAHADRYLEKFNLLQWPPQTELVCAKLAAAARELRPRTVVGPAIGGVIIAYEVARQLGVRGIIAEKDPGGSGLAIQRDFRLEPGERVLVVDDILTSGGSVRQTLDAVRAAGGEPIAVAVMVDRSGGKVDFGIPLFAATEIELPSYDPASCPLCARGVPLKARTR
jgi:orotate phosphoribosyltransferase